MAQLTSNPVRLLLLVFILELAQFTTLNAQGAVVVYTYASYVDSTTSRFTSGVRPNGAGIWVSFQYKVNGGGTIYSTPGQMVPADTGIVEITQTIPSLLPNTTYVYWVVIDFQYGGPQQLMNTGTHITTPKLIALPADSITATSVRVRALCISHGLRAAVYFHWSVNYSDPNYWDGQTQVATISEASEETVITAIITDQIPASTLYISTFATGIDSSFGCQASRTKVRTLFDSSARTLTIPLTIFAGGFTQERLTFGVQTHATYCRDAGLGEDELPPGPPGWDARFIDSRTGNGRCFAGGMGIDIRKYYSPSQVDTYKIKFQGLPPYTIEWPELSGSYGGAVIMHIPGGDIKDMKTSRSVLIDSEDPVIVTIIAQDPITEPAKPIIIFQKSEFKDSSSVRLSAAVYPNGFSTKTWFAWGKTTQYDQATPPLEIGRESGDSSFHSDLDSLLSGTTYHFCLVTQNVSGKTYGTDIAFLTPGLTSIEEAKPFPMVFHLGQNYPNPFNPTTTLEYDLPVDSKVHLTICNLLGQIVATLADDVESAGYKSFEWNASNVSSGIYFYRLEATSVADPVKSFTQVRKMLLLK